MQTKITETSDFLHPAVKAIYRIKKLADISDIDKSFQRQRTTNTAINELDHSLVYKEKIN